MSDLISRSALIKILNHRASEHRENYEDFMGYMGERKTIHYTELKECKSIIDIVDNAPTVEARPVVHGEWIKYRLSKLFKYTCSVCHCDVEEKTPFCPWCTADMRGGKNE